MPDEHDRPIAAPPGPAARPQRIEPTAPPAKPKRKRRRWLATVVAALVLIVALAAGLTWFIARPEPGPSTEDQIRTAIDDFGTALGSGDLAALQSVTCGPLGDYYRTVPPDEFAQVHRATVEQGSIPVVASVDAIQVTDDTSAIAQITAYRPADPANRSVRTFNLLNTPAGWQVCEPPL
ncbi:hypothetical protein OG921_02155 [Aldersonia sp. NBC_00410]|uniref:Rv0361 family membrane protein n=1 Tax=Aldersonia sp. NBC_00410 TaxID=2975954 RepID=UPI002251BD1D|nr:hypothetical protein [Aldersonia sp. NBC_00410]MCX5041998.1 hypothetical protein [Aldersonia sp. NBC_00410]